MPIKVGDTSIQQSLEVTEAYGFDPKKDLLSQLLELNLSVSAKEEKGKIVQSPGWPEEIKGREKYVTEDCVRFEE